MSHSHILTMKRPYEALGLPIPIGRRLGSLGKGVWVAGMVVLTLAFGAAYIVETTQSASRAYAMRDLQNSRDRLMESVNSLESQAAELQSLHALQERVQGMGYVPVEHLEFMDVTRPSVALAK